jgi:hypothetical protein
MTRTSRPMLSSQFVYMLLGVVEIGAPCSSLISNYRVVGEMPVLQVFLEFSPAGSLFFSKITLILGK